MTDSNATPTVRRDRPTKYPRNLAVMLTDELYDAVAEASDLSGMSKAAIVREALTEHFTDVAP